MEVFLIATDETAVLAQIALGETVHSQRAQALLCLAEVDSFVEAATQSGLSENQVKYWAGRFRARRLTIFPDDLVTAVSKEVTSTTDSGGEIVAEEQGVVGQEIEREGVEVIEESADVDKGKKRKKKNKSKGKKKEDKNKIDMKKTGKKDKKKKKEGKQKSAKKKDDKKKKSDSKQKIDKKKKKHSEKKKSKKKKKLDGVKKSNKGKSKKSKKKGKKNK